jgi:hypothetical protein
VSSETAGEMVALAHEPEATQCRGRRIGRRHDKARAGYCGRMSNPGYMPWAWYADTWPDNTPDGNIPHKWATVACSVESPVRDLCRIRLGARRPGATRGRIERGEWEREREKRRVSGPWPRFRDPPTDDEEGGNDGDVNRAIRQG